MSPLFCFNPEPDGLQLTLAPDVSRHCLDGRLSLLRQVNQGLDLLAQSPETHRFDLQSRQAVDLLRSTAARRAFDLSRENPCIRDRFLWNFPFGNNNDDRMSVKNYK